MGEHPAADRADVSLPAGIIALVFCFALDQAHIPHAVVTHAVINDVSHAVVTSLCVHTVPARLRFSMSVHAACQSLATHIKNCMQEAASHTHPLLFHSLMCRNCLLLPNTILSPHCYPQHCCRMCTAYLNPSKIVVIIATATQRKMKTHCGSNE